MGVWDAILTYDEDKIKALYHRAWLECNRGNVDPRKFPYLDKALFVFAKENNCTYDQAYILAKTGKKLF